MTELVNFAHSFETVMDAIRSETLALTPQIMHTLMRSADCLADLVDAARSGRTISQDVTSGFLTALQACLGEGEIEAVDAWDNFEFNAVTLDLEPITPEMPVAEFVERAPIGQTDQVQIGFQIAFRPHAALFTNGHEPALLFAALGDLGQMTSHIDLTNLADWSDFNPIEPRLSWTVDLRTDESEISVQEVFEFVHGLCDLTIKPLMGAPVRAVMGPVDDAKGSQAEMDMAQSVAVGEPAAPPVQGASLRHWPCPTPRLRRPPKPN